jgi:hypothetical protein
MTDPVITIRISRRLLFGCLAALVVVVVLAVALTVLGFVVTGSSGDSNGTPVIATAAGAATTRAVVGAVATLTLKDGSTTRVTLENIWQGGNGPNIAVRFEKGTASLQDPGGWSYVLEDGTVLALRSNLDRADTYHLWLDRGVPQGHTVKAIRFQPVGQGAIEFKLD